MTLLVDIRNFKRIKRLQVEKKIFFADLSILFVRNNEYKKIKLDLTLRTILGFTLVNRELFANTIRSSQAWSGLQIPCHILLLCDYFRFDWFL
jgi:hypothetical protein